MSPSVAPTSLSSSELQTLTVRALTLENNWKRDAPRIRSYRSLDCSSAAAIDEMFLLNRARWLVTAQRTRRNGSPLAQICLWALPHPHTHPNLNNDHGAYCAASLEIPGRYRKIAAVVDEERERATFAVTTDADDNESVVLFLSVPLTRLSHEYVAVSCKSTLSTSSSATKQSGSHGLTPTLGNGPLNGQDGQRALFRT